MSSSRRRHHTSTEGSGGEGQGTPWWLGIEGGGTRTVALWVDGAGRCVRRHEAGPGNIALLNDGQLASLFEEIARQTTPPAAIAIGMAGARGERERERIKAGSSKVWPGVPCLATHDLDTALAAVDDPAEDVGGRTPARRGATPARVLVLSGTGSCCYGQVGREPGIKVGGWGHWLGDEGSAYKIALNALRGTVAEFDRTGRWPELGRRILRALQLNEPDELVGFAQQAAKAEVAALASTVIEAAKAGDRLARGVIAQAAETLAGQALECAQRLTSSARPRRRAGEQRPVEFVFAGGLLLNEPSYARQVARWLRQGRKGARILRLTRESAWGAVRLARELAQGGGAGGPSGQARPLGNGVGATDAPALAAAGKASLAALAQSPTEQRNPRSMNLDRLSVRAGIELMAGEDAQVPAAILRQIEPLTALIEAVIQAFRRGRRLWYLGAGTSGRLGVLDASECPPTFRCPPDQVQGIMAGGHRALWDSIEGAEDDPEAGARAVAYRGVARGDVVVGIAASGRTPFVWGALKAARQQGARTALVTFNPHHAIAPQDRPNFVVAVDAGPEVLTGSTRLKAGTATKMILNMITTLSMTGIGKVVSNLMVDLHPSNVKLRDRAVRIVCQLRDTTPEQAQQGLEAAEWSIPRALDRLAPKVPRKGRP